MRGETAARGAVRERKGQTLAEYVLVLSFIAMACVAGLTLMGSSISGFFNGFGGGF